MRHSLFHTSLKFYLLVLILNRTFSDCTESANCTQSTQEFLLLISSKVKFFAAYSPKKSGLKSCQCLVATCTRNTAGTHSVKSVQLVYPKAVGTSDSVGIPGTFGTTGTLLYMT